MHDSDVSAYTYERTLMMEQRNEMLHDMRVSKKNQSKLVDSILDSSRHHDLGISAQKSPSKVQFSEELNGDVEDTTGTTGGQNNHTRDYKSIKSSDSITPENSNVRRMHTAVKLNEAIVAKSHDAKLVILNLPGPPKVVGADKDCSYMEFLEVLTEGLERVLMVRGGGREVITIYS
jgi:potassium/chloride transporter 4/5/6